jgi:23S rRNA pseudouridine1911/1915/1917 synthase
MKKLHESRQRLDHYLSLKYPEISRGFLQKLIADGQVTVNGSAQKSGYKLGPDDKVDILYDMASIGKVPSIELPILYEDDDVLVVNKPAGVLSHALTKFHNEPSVASFLRQHINKKPGKNTDIRFGIVHRLDRATSGVMICAKNHKTLSSLQRQFGERKVKKVYQAVVSGRPKQDAAIIDVPIDRNPQAPATFKPGPNGKSAQTDYELIEASEHFARVRLHPLTGRTHQLRVHLKYIGTPIIGDLLYEGKPAERLYLHAERLSLKVNGKTTTFTAPVPAEFKKTIKKDEIC